MNGIFRGGSVLANWATSCRPELKCLGPFRVCAREGPLRLDCLQRTQCAVDSPRISNTRQLEQWWFSLPCFFGFDARRGFISFAGAAVLTGGDLDATDE